MIIKKTIVITKEIPHDADMKKWMDDGWVEVVKERPKKVKPKKTAKKKTKKKK
tara:strand:+ start:183 stop:341 length:159 start_codon:yes stop_codon:yes gene_type:complete